MRIAFRQIWQSLAVALLAGGSACPGMGQTAITFQAPITIDRPVPAPVYGVSGTPLITGDWDSDGRLDLCVITREGVSLLYGNGDGSFAPPIAYALGSYLQEGVAADVNGDGKPDLVLCDFPLGKVLVLLNKDGRQFAPPVNYPVADHPVGVTAADFNGDGAVDLAVSCHEVGTLCVLLNRADGRFLPPVFYGGLTYGGGIVSTDFNADGKMDLAQTSLVQNLVRILLGDGTGKFTGIGGFQTATEYANRLSTDDFNGDGIPDLAVPSLGSYAILFGDGTGRFGAPIRYLGYQVMDVGDFDGDGDPDLVAPRGDSSGLSLFQNHIDGNFLNAVTIPGPGTKSFAARVGDFNGDGRPDVMAWDEALPHLLMYLNNTPRPATTIRSLVLNPGTVIAGCDAMKGTVILTTAAPAGGAIVSLQTNNPAVQPPVSVKVAEGEARVNFAIALDTVTSPQAGSILASYNGSGRRAAFLVKPAGVVSLTLNPASVIGGQPAMGQITLRCPAATPGVSIPLTTNNANGVQLPATVTVPAGMTSGSFAITTRTVNAAIAVVITARIDDQALTAALEVRPVPSPPPLPTPPGPIQNPANGHWYQAVRTPGTVTWPQAREAAAALTHQGLKGHLVAITSADENQFLIKRVVNISGGPYDWWLGGYQDPRAPDYSEPAGGWRWITGEPWGYTGWGSGEPNNTPNENALHMSRFNSIWNDLPDSYPLNGYVVEFEPLPITGAVSASQLVLFPNPVLGGLFALGQVTLSQPAGAGGQVITLLSSSPITALVPPNAIVPPNASTVTFPILTFPVTAATPVQITAGGSSASATATLQVLPLSTPPLPTPATNLLVNGSFEEPPITNGAPFRTLRPDGLPGWRIVGGTVDVHQSWQQAPGQGRQSLGLVGDRAGAVEQSIATEPGREYLFSGWLSHDYGNGVTEGRANVHLNEAFFVQLYHNLPATEADMRWVQFAYRFRATTAVTTLTLTDVTGRTNLQGAVLDGLSVTPVVGADPPAPAAPTGLSVSRLLANQVTLTWRDNSSNERAFAIWRRGGGADWTRVGVVVPDRTTFTDTGLRPRTTYTYRVRATNQFASDWSNEVTVTTPAP